jgi:hypothetical protein
MRLSTGIAIGRQAKMRSPFRPSGRDGRARSAGRPIAHSINRSAAIEIGLLDAAPQSGMSEC